jgi:TatD DNase family protein
MKLYDAHAHYAAPSLLQHWEQVSAGLQQIDLRYAVVNGTSPNDWPTVLQLAAQEPRIIPAIGLHPWRVNTAPANWQDRFLAALRRGAQVIGEIGLDTRFDGADIQLQQDAFRWQLRHATERNLPASIHCLKAIGPLMDCLRSMDLPQRGIHLHAYNGPVELIAELVELGAYFSFNAGQLKATHRKTTARIQAVPSERLLVETDAPNMLPAPALRAFELPRSEHGEALTHPATLQNGYEAIAQLRGVSVEQLTTAVAINFQTYFLNTTDHPRPRCA